MKKFLFILFLFSQFIYSQEIYVKYIYNTSPTVQYVENLYISRNTKIAITDSIPYKRKGIELFNDNDGSINQVSKSKHPKFKKIIIDKNIKAHEAVLEINQIESTNYQIIDEIPKINWNINHTDIKKIGKYNCRKATAEYRGNNYIAYYTKEIPISAGPYKFKGLPGLILELESDGINKQHWLLTEIEFPFKGEIPLNYNYIRKLPVITKKAFVEKADKKQREEYEIRESKIAKGAISTEVTFYRLGIEQKYEWEKNKK